MGRGVGIEDLVQRSLAGQLYKKDGPVYYAKTGKWKVENEAQTGGLTVTGRLFHYGTKMLEWKIDTRRGTAAITGWWIGWGSASDQEGVNAALRGLGSSLRYHRDTRGGGPRVNPGYRVSASVGRAASSISAITPPEY